MSSGATLIGDYRPFREQTHAFQLSISAQCWIRMLAWRSFLHGALALSRYRASGHRARWGKLGHLTGSCSNAGCRLPCRQGLEAGEIGGKSRAAGVVRDKDIAVSREDTDQPLQASRRP